MGKSREGKRPPAVMEAKSADAIPSGKTWQYEPKWDGFRCILDRKDSRVRMWSKSGEDLTRYFPEIVESAKLLERNEFALDGELVVPQGKTFSFDALLQRIHPAQSRVIKLASETPAVFIAFDILREGQKKLESLPLSRRRAALEQFASKYFLSNPSFRLSAASHKIQIAKKWLALAGGGSDGVIAKRLDLPYQAGNRNGMQKIKLIRTADCVIGGFRYAQSKIGKDRVVGSLLLGLYDSGGLLHHVGFTSGLKSQDKVELTKKLKAIAAKTSFNGNAPGGPSRWSTKRSQEWIAVKPKFVVEVSYDHFTGRRFRHGTGLMRWRPDKSPRQCTMDQLKQKFIAPEKLLSAR
jgi:ATP-dependent DNA ligase